MISIVIPNYNGEDLLRRNIPRVLEAADYHQHKSKNKVEIIVVDDCSTDDSINVIKGMGVKVLKNTKNLGFSSTVNKGVETAKGDIVVLLNTDIYPEKTFLKHLIEHFNDPQVFAVGCLDKSIEGGETILRGRGIGKWKNGFLVHSRGNIDKSNTLWASGGSAAFRKNVWKKLSGFDELYNPFYWEDIDLSYRALKSGYKIVFEPKSIVFHEHYKGSIKKNYSDFKIKTIAYRNQFIFSWKNATDLPLQISEILFLPYHFALALKRRDWAFFVGFLKAFVLLPKIIQSSLRAQRLFVRSDKDVVDEFKQ